MLFSLAPIRRPDELAFAPTPARFTGLAVLLALALAASAQARDGQIHGQGRCGESDGTPLAIPRITFTDSTIEAKPATEDGRSSLKVSIPSGGSTVGGVALTDATLINGTIEVDFQSRLAPDAPEGSRGFAGIAFRAAQDASRYEAIYVRPENGRAREQIRRNHATQYVSYPDYPWFRLREEFPGHYESYVDLRLGVWTNLRLEISGSEALLFVNRAEQPALVVRNMKLGPDRSGQVGLWIGSGTVAYFANLSVNRCG